MSVNFSCSQPYTVLLAAACGFSIGYLYASARATPGAPIRGQAIRTSLLLADAGAGAAPDLGKAAQRAGQPAGVPRVCIVTGGSRGIGAAICERLAADGYKVVINYQSNKTRAEAVLAQIRRNGGSAICVQADVSNAEQVSLMFDEAERHFGSVTSCVNNAGILGPLTGLCDDETIAQCPQVMATNLYGSLYVMREACKRMSTTKAGKGGAIVNLGAGSAYTGNPLAYAMSKGALNSLTAGCVNELAAGGIRLNTVSPGPTYSDMMQNFSEADIAWMASAIPMQRPGEAAEVAATVAWLLSDDASFVAGTNLRVAGGKSLEA